MNRAVTTLLFVLMIQCGIVFAVYWPQQSAMQQPDAHTLLPFDPAGINQIRVGDEHRNEAILRKQGAHWVLPQLQDLPVNPSKLEQLVSGISSTENGWPVAHSTAARQRFQVADYHHRRKLTLMNNDQTLGIIYLGTSPGFRKVHARSAERDAIYSITYNAFDAAGSAGAWLDPRLLQIRAPLAITADAYSLDRSTGQWLSGSGNVPDDRELQALLGALRTLQVDGVAAENEQAGLSGAEAELLLQIDSLAGEVTLQLFTLDDKHFIHSSQYSLFFRLSAYDFDRMNSIDFDLISSGADGQ